ncbi:MAG: hypothetical protein Ct9H300mP5_1630 [Candidatus Pelagibacterales bacterium]|nr:MAG: hypothetical protein Ct9H300mP5_1630 [Pelagibacterales bacterium]
MLGEKAKTFENQIILLADVRGEFTKKKGAEFNWGGLGVKIDEIYNVIRE